MRIALRMFFGMVEGPLDEKYAMERTLAPSFELITVAGNVPKVDATALDSSSIKTTPMPPRFFTTSFFSLGE
ncbi:hypothetical protein QQP08_022873 [Theobroma cacao]|nr:hypothetical protein QQP08_022873 [Theobroma cacao]